MDKKNTKRVDIINRQLSKIDTINEMIQMAKDGDDEFSLKQYKHLKKEYVKNLFEMLAENYQIPIPTAAAASTETKKEAA
ncbi:MAG: hypothetical protein AAGJ18_25795 [Bacteroidota bacterium]